MSEEEIIKAHDELMDALGFKCQKCGFCCHIPIASEGFFPLLESDYHRIKNKRNIKRGNYNVRWVYGCLKHRDDRSCMFLKNNICEIYKDRPFLCRLYPIQLLTTDKIEVNDGCKWVKDNIGLFALRPSKKINELYNRYIQLMSIFKQNKKKM